MKEIASETKARSNRRKLTTPFLLAGTAETSPEIEYLTGLRLSERAVCLAAGGEVYLVVPRFEYRRATGAAGTSVFTPEMLGVHPGGRDAAWCAALLKRFDVRAVRVLPDFPLGIADALRRQGVRLVLSDRPAERAVKTAEEIGKMTEVQQAAVIAMRSAVEMIARAEIDEKGILRAHGERLTSEHVRRAARHVLLDHGCFGRDIIVACGTQGAQPHAQGTGPLRAREPILIDIFPRHLEHGYWGDLTRTVVRGGAEPAVRRMYGAVRAAQAAALAAIRPGARGAAVHRAADRELTARGYQAVGTLTDVWGFGHSTGHGLGLMLHEMPVLGAGDVRLRAGMVLAIEPGIYDPRIGGIRLEDVIVVTAEGWRYLVPCEKRLEV
jgi:Xaa-Pro aminopeptidase